MNSDDIDRMIEEMATNKISERTRELAIQSGLIAPYGSDHEGLRDFDYRKFAELVRADEREWVGLTPTEFNSIKDTSTTIGYAITKTEAMLKEKNAS